MNLVSELIIAKNGLVSAGAASPSGQMANAQAFHEQINLEQVTTNLHESVMKVRMVPIESVVNRYRRRPLTGLDGHGDVLGAGADGNDFVDHGLFLVGGSQNNAGDGGLGRLVGFQQNVICHGLEFHFEFLHTIQ